MHGSKIRFNHMAQSWGNVDKESHSKELKVNWIDDISKINESETILSHGNGRTYSNSCLNKDGDLLLTRSLNKFISFDQTNGTLECESGLTFEEILNLIVPRGWFLPVTPGTKYVTLGGAIANDIHGKNHHSMGNFGNHLESITLYNTEAGIFRCSPNEKADYFEATIGGIGLTGVILSAKFKLIPIQSQMINQEMVKFNNLDEFFEINKQSKNYTYTVAWIDCMAKGKKLGRGHYIRGEHVNADDQTLHKKFETSKKTVPFNFPNFTLNSYSIKAFNSLYFRKFLGKQVDSTTHFNPFFYPLDSINNWNRIYGKNGFYQYQFVVPHRDGIDAVREVFKEISKSGQGSFLGVLKTFGDTPAKGMMSFPMEGITLALDFRNQGEKTLKLFSRLDKIVNEVDGRLYIAKDTRLPKNLFEKFYPNFNKFKQYIDPKFSSSFWRRINE